MHKIRLDVRLGFIVAFLFVSLALVVSPAIAQGTARIMDVDGSAISSAMGGASAAVFWSAEPNYWANPALLGYYRGVRYQYARSQLVPGLADDVFLTSDRVTLGAFGVGLEVGRTNLDYGGSYESYEKVGAIAVGASLSGLVRSVVPGSPAAALARNLDLAVGFARKDVEVSLAPWREAEASGHPCDIGVLLRGGLDLGVLGRVATPVRLEAGFGASVLNFNDVDFSFAGDDESVPPSRLRRLGGAVRLAVGQPTSWSRRAGSGFAAAFLRGLGPPLSVGAAWDAEHVQAGDESDDGYDVTHLGAELALLNVLSVRVGHVTDRTGGIEDATWGLGVGLPIAGVAGARYDYAQYPQSSSLPNVTRHTASVFVDPLALWRLTREE
jgi:hypothetical protein